MMTGVAEIIEKLKGAEKGSAELDFLVCDATNPYASGPYSHTPSMMKAFGYDRQVTTSLDAALALAERVLPGWVWDVSSTGCAWIMDAGRFDSHTAATASTAPLALCIAILRALNLNETRHD